MRRPAWHGQTCTHCRGACGSLKKRILANMRRAMLPCRSMGGMVALAMAQQQADKWSGLVLVDTAAGGPGERRGGEL